MKEFLLTNLKRSCDEFEQIDKEIEIESDKELKEKVHTISKKCSLITNISLNSLNEKSFEEKLTDIEDCAMGLSEIRNWLDSSIKDKSLNKEIGEISNYFGSLEVMADRLKFIDSIQSESPDSHDTLMKIMKKKREENGMD